MIVNSRRQQDKYYADLIYIFLLFHLIKQYDYFIFKNLFLKLLFNFYD